MKKIRKFMVIGVLISLFVYGITGMEKCCYSATRYSETTINVKVTKIVDGDTVKVALPQGNYSVRLYGIDCYESFANKHINSQMKKTGYSKEIIIMMGREATKLLSAKLSPNDDIQLEIIGLDTKYGRLVGNIYKNGENLNLYMKNSSYCPAYEYKSAKKL